MTPIAHGPGPLPGCLEGLRHVFAPGAATCGCGFSTRPPTALGWITTAPESLTPSLHHEEKS